MTKFIKTTKLSQKGMTAILFTMVFIVILSLLAIGFASLVRKDQQQALDKSLSYQAQYAAETAVNREKARVQQFIVANNIAGYTPITSCQQSVIGDAKVTCLTTDNTIDSIVSDVDDEKQFVSLLKSNGAPITSVDITWTNKNGATAGYPGISHALPQNFSSAMHSILRITIADTVGNAKTAYVVPTAGGTGDSPPLNGNWNDGSIDVVNCNGSGSCTITLKTMGDNNKIAILAYGGASNVVITPHSPNNIKFENAQLIIDANARISDVTKRVEGRVNLQKGGWRPAYSVSADIVCKDFRVDASQNTSASGAASPCPL